MAVTRKRERERGVAWLRGVPDVLKGGVLGGGISVLLLAAAACLVWFGAPGSGQESGAVVAACLLGSFAGGLFAVKRGRTASLFGGVGVGVVLFLLLLTAGVVFLHAAPTLCGSGTTAGACLCGGGLAGVLGRGGAKKRRRR